MLHDVSPAAWQWLQGKIPHLIHSIHTEGPHAGHRGAHRHLHVVAYDTPETDSHIKQMAAHIGELVNHRYIHVHKEGAQGIQAWRISNPHYHRGTAHPQAVNFQAGNRSARF